MAEESRAVEALTSVWLLSAVSALVCELGTAACAWYAATHENAVKMALLAGLLWLVSIVLGGVTLVVTPLVHRLRTVPPPRSVTAFALVVGIGPIAAWGVGWALN